MYELAKDILEFYNVIPVAYGKCPNCGVECNEVMVRETKTSDKGSLPWVLFFKDIYTLPIINCCGQLIYPSYIRLKAQATADYNLDPSFFDKDQIYKIGTIKVPVITDDLLSYPITRSYQEQLEIQKQLQQQIRLLHRKQQPFMNSCYTYFTLHFDEVIKEIDGAEMLDVLDALMSTPYGMHLKDAKSPKSIKKDKKAYLNWVKKQIRNIVEQENEQGKQMVFYLIVKYFIEWELIQGIYYLHWNAHKYQKMIGKTLLLYMILQFPLTNYFSYLREDAIHKLVQTSGSQRKRQELMQVFQKKLDKASINVDKLQEANNRQREANFVLEEKNRSLQIKNDLLLQQLQLLGEQSTNDSSQTRKIKELKGIIESQRSELVSLRDLKLEKLMTIQNDIDANGIEEQTTLLLTEHMEEQNLYAEPRGKFAAIQGKTIGIFGDIQIVTEGLDLPCEIKSADSVQDIEGQSVMNNSDVLVVLTQHISHNCMWTIKSYASAHEIPVLFSRHSNVKIIIDQVANLINDIEREID